MIPSPTKLALLTGVVLVLGEVACHPARYDERQEGDFNVRADVEDVVLVAVPPKDYIANGMTWFGVNFVRNNHWKSPTRIKGRFPSKLGFAPKEKSPYKVDLGKSSVPVMKLRSPAPPVEEAAKPRRDRNRGDRDEAEGAGEATPEVEVPSSAATETAEAAATTSGSKTVKKELKKEAEKDAAPEGEKEKAPAVKAQAPKKAAEAKPTAATNSPLVPIGVGSDPNSNTRVEGCGPLAHRDSTGMCIYE